MYIYIWGLPQGLSIYCLGTWTLTVTYNRLIEALRLFAISRFRVAEVEGLALTAPPISSSWLGKNINVHFYSLLGLSTHKTVKCYPTVTK